MSADGRVATVQARPDEDRILIAQESGVLFPLPGKTRYGRLRPPSRLKMNSLRSALTAVLARQRIQPSGKGKQNTTNLHKQRTNCLTSTGLLMEADMNEAAVAADGFACVR